MLVNTIFHVSSVHCADSEHERDVCCGHEKEECEEIVADKLDQEVVLLAQWLGVNDIEDHKDGEAEDACHDHTYLKD